MAFLSLLRSEHRFPGGFRKTLLEQLFTLQQEGLGKSVKILKHFARGRIILIN
jgi:hypothetical protein